MDALIIVDMQVGLLDGPPKHDLQGVIARINALAEKVRREHGDVIWIRHCGKAGDEFHRNSPKWEFLPDLDRQDTDQVVEKTLNDPYVGTPLAEMLAGMRPDRVLVTGWATDFCVDATVRSTISHGHHLFAVEDAHTLNDRPHLSAATIITHHNSLWRGLITHRSIRVGPTSELLAENTQPDAGKEI